MASEEKIELPKIGHIGIVVRNLKKAMERYSAIFGIGPWTVYDHHTVPDLKDTHVHGKLVKYTMKTGWASVREGPIAFELIEPIEGPSIYKESLEEKGEGIHHIYFEGCDFEKVKAQFKKRGIEILMDASCKGNYWAYMDTEKILGFVIEISK